MKIISVGKDGVSAGAYALHLREYIKEDVLGGFLILQTHLPHLLPIRISKPFNNFLQSLSPKPLTSSSTVEQSLPSLLLPNFIQTRKNVYRQDYRDYYHYPDASASSASVP